MIQAHIHNHPQPDTHSSEPVDIANLERQLRRALHAIWAVQGRRMKIVEVRSSVYEVKVHRVDNT
jgi:hypothetical protein